MSELISNNVNINIEGIGEPAVKLLEKISNVLDWNATNMGAHRLAQAEFIGFIKSTDSIPDSIKPALIYNSKRILKEFANQQDVISYGISLLNDIVFVDDIENEWLYEFMDGAGKASSEELKLIWGKILATECNENNSIPKRLLFILKQMDSDVASSFTKLCSTCIHFINDDKEIEYQPIVVGYKPDNRCPLSYNEIIELATLGLIEYHDPITGSYTILGLNDNQTIMYYDKEYGGLINDGVLQVGFVIFTHAGEALAKIIDVDPLPNYIEDCYLPFCEHIQEWKKDLELITKE